MNLEKIAVEKLLINLETKVDRSGRCHVWTGYRDKDGYGRILVKGRSFGVHRLAFQIANIKIIPDGLCVLHQCDNPSCINPDHLFLGTHAENMADRMQKGRNNHVVKFPDSCVKQIKTGLSRHIAKSVFGVSKYQYYRIRNGEQRVFA